MSCIDIIRPLDNDPGEFMKTSLRFRLACALCLLLIGLLVGLLAHSVPASTLCGCMEAQDDAVVGWEFDTCLVCQLQSGVIFTAILSLFSDGKMFRMDHLANLTHLEHADQISRPPIRV